MLWIVAHTGARGATEAKRRAEQPAAAGAKPGAGAWTAFPTSWYEQA